LTSPNGAAPRWRKSRGNLFQRNIVSSIEAEPQGNTRPTLTTNRCQAPGSLPSPVAGAADGEGRDQRLGRICWRQKDLRPDRFLKADPGSEGDRAVPFMHYHDSAATIHTPTDIVKSRSTMKVF
jgi:hypothetical protein